MKTLKVGVVDLLGKSASRKMWGRFIQATYPSIMPQVIAAWCEEFGHRVSISYFAGPRLLSGELPDDLDIAFIASYTNTAQVAYALSAFLRSKGAVTVLGGPHTRSYPEDSVKYFDYAVGYCGKEQVEDILRDCSPHRPIGEFVTASAHPTHLPGVEARWKYMQPILNEAKLVKAIPVVGSLGCAYSCDFCRDALVPYQPLDFDELIADLRFIHSKSLRRSILSWHDPNFGIRFNDYMNVMEEAVPDGSLISGAGMSFALLKEENCKRLEKNGFRVVLPGIESWFDMGDKSKLKNVKGREKVDRIAEQTNMVLEYIPYVQGCLIFGLDADEGPEPFELTKVFSDAAPGLFPNISLLTAYGGNAPDNLRYQRDGRVLNIPFHFLNQLHCMNIRPKNYSWTEFYDYAVDLVSYVFSPRTLAKRFTARTTFGTKVEQVTRGVSSGRNQLLRNLRMQRSWFEDKNTAKYFDGETEEIPDFFRETIKKDLDWLWHWLPKEAIRHDQNAGLKSLGGDLTKVPKIRAGMTAS